MNGIVETLVLGPLDTLQIHTLHVHLPKWAEGEEGN